MMHRNEPDIIDKMLYPRDFGISEPRALVWGVKEIRRLRRVIWIYRVAAVVSALCAAVYLGVLG